VADYATYGDNEALDMTVDSGDKLVLAAWVRQSPYERGATVRDLTTGVTRTSDTSLGQLAPEWAMVGVSRFAQVVDFGKVEWSKVQVDGAALGSASPQGLIMSIHPNHPAMLVGTSALSPAGASFKNFWVRGW
jgi:hypothetical protein